MNQAKEIYNKHIKPIEVYKDFTSFYYHMKHYFKWHIKYGLYKSELLPWHVDIKKLEQYIYGKFVLFSLFRFIHRSAQTKLYISEGCTSNQHLRLLEVDMYLAV